MVPGGLSVLAITGASSRTSAQLFIRQQRSGYYFSCWWLKGNHTLSFHGNLWLNETSAMGVRYFIALERPLKGPLRELSGKQAIEGVWSKISIKLWWYCGWGENKPSPYIRWREPQIHIAILSPKLTEACLPQKKGISFSSWLLVFN